MKSRETLTVFDIQRFALHDGPGIRTTVFLKGCPLDCLWCHNPESKKSRPQLGFLEKKCTGCGRCEKVCPQKAHSITENGQEGWEHKIQFEHCIQCGKCVDVCLNHALKMFGTQMSAEQILATVKKDMDFYQRSGGGLTVSGGEPMMQAEPLRGLLQMAKENGIHVCLDTSGQASTEAYEKIAPWVDLFLFDYKVTGEAEHRKYTGVGNHLILKNLDWLCRHGYPVWLRCPIIPGINDNLEHYRRIAELSEQYESILQVNLMTYHDMAKGKTAQIGESFALSGISTIGKEEKQEIYRKVENCGCKKLREG